MKHRLSFLLFVVVGCLTSAYGAERPNLIFFLSDDHRADVLGCAGHPIIKTPNIDKLASQGRRFVNAFVTTSIYAASRASIFTGLVERTHGYTFGMAPISTEHVADSYPAKFKRLATAPGSSGSSA